MASCASAVRKAALKIGFPMLVKPAMGTGGSGIFTADDAAQLEARLPPSGSFVMQSFVSGRVAGAPRVQSAAAPVLRLGRPAGETALPLKTGLRPSKKRCKAPEF